MIRHIVMFSAKNPDDVDRIIETLRTYKDIPGVRNLEVARNTKRDALSSDVDVVLHACFESEEDLAAYKAHDLYKAGIDIVRPLRNIRIVADYDLADASESGSRSD